MKDSPEFNIFFVSLIEKHRCVYDFNHSDYFNKSKQDSAWETIASQVEEPIAECKERWKNLRACYSRHKKTLKYPTNGSRFKRPYYLAEPLHFIDQFTKTRIPKDSHLKSELTAESTNVESVRQLEAKDESEESDDGNMLHEIDIKEEPCATFYSPPVKRVREDSCGEAKAKGSQSNIESADLSFLKSMLPDMVEMSGEQKRRFKAGIINLAQLILDENMFTSN